MLLYDKSENIEVGIDEAGRGPLAGPVVAAAVIFPHDINLPEDTLIKDGSEKYKIFELSNAIVAQYSQFSPLSSLLKT